MTAPTSDLVAGYISKFTREQGFGTITLEDGRALPFDASICAMKPEEGDQVHVRVGKARWGGGEKAVHVQPLAAGSGPVTAARELTLDQRIGELQAAHLLAGLTESVQHQLVADRFGGDVTKATLLAIVDAYYEADSARAHHDGYVRHDARDGAVIAPVLAELAARLPDVRLPDSIASRTELVPVVNATLAAAGDQRRLYALATNGYWHAYYVLTPDRARAVHAVLPFTIAP